MEFKPSAHASSSTLKEIMPEGDFDENGLNLKLSLGQPSSLDLQLHLNAAPKKVHKCQVCKCTETPIWRTGPKGMKTLCNACGLKYKKYRHRRQSYLAAGKPLWFARGIDREFAKLIGDINHQGGN